jgi:hypothetical protein
MKAETIKLDGMEKSAKAHTVFRVSNGKVESRAIRDFYDSRLEVGDKVDIYRVTKRQFIELMPGDYLVRKEGTHVIG